VVDGEKKAEETPPQKRWGRATKPSDYAVEHLPGWEDHEWDYGDEDDEDDETKE
jgi:hypothetical protein